MMSIQPSHTSYTEPPKKQENEPYAAHHNEGDRSEYVFVTISELDRNA